MGCLEPFLSIIVPIYNVPERYLRKCIESLINQTFKDIEILLIDDGSTDNSSLICDEYSASNENITTIHKENGGLSSARNKGVREASGKYIMFVDGDDWINPESCEVLHNCFNNNDVDLIMFCMSKDYEESTTPYLYFLKENYIYKDDEIKWLQSQVLNYNSNIATVTTKLIKRELLISNNVFHNEQLKQGAEGIVFNIDLFGTVRSAVFIKKYLYHYLYNESSISASYNEAIEGRIEVQVARHDPVNTFHFAAHAGTGCGVRRLGVMINPAAHRGIEGLRGTDIENIHIRSAVAHVPRFSQTVIRRLGNHFPRSAGSHDRQQGCHGSRYCYRLSHTHFFCAKIGIFRGSFVFL